MQIFKALEPDVQFGCCSAFKEEKKHIYSCGAKMKINSDN